MAATAGSSQIDRLGFAPGHIVQEFGWGEDVDDDLRLEIEELVGNELVDEDYDDVTDGVIVWWREGDGDLIEEAASTAGLHPMSTLSIAEDWSATKLAHRGRGR